MHRDTLRKILDEDEFGLLELPVKQKALTADERLASGFQEIVAFVEAHGREPEENPTDMNESKLRWRLDAINADTSQREALSDLDSAGLLKEPVAPTSVAEVLEADVSGILDGPGDDLFELRNVPSYRPTVENAAQREPCEDFDEFEPLFKQCHKELTSGERRLRAFKNPSQLRPHTFFVESGVLGYVAAMGEQTLDKKRRHNARLRCIFENGTESGLLVQSLASNLYKAGKLVTDPVELTIDEMELSSDTRMASIYVLKSLSDDPQLARISNVHKIGVTSQNVENRVASASDEGTFLGAPVEILAEYRLPFVVAESIEGVLHDFFADVRLDIWFEENGRTVSKANEWFSAPLDVIDAAIDLINSEAIVDYFYDPASQQMRLRP